VAKIRTGRANSSIVDDVKVEYYGQETQLREVANVSIPEPRQIKVEVWDDNAVDAVEKGLSEADLGASPNRIDDKTLIINLPSLTGEARKRMIKKLHDKAEETRVSVRNIREDRWKKAQKEEQKGEITEDDKYTIKDKLQGMVDEANEEIERVKEKKEEELEK